MEQKVRKQVYLDVELEAQLKREAQERGISEAELIRQALSDEFESSTEKSLRLGRLDPQAWEREKAFIESLMQKGSISGGRSWGRDELYEERLNPDGDAH